MTQNCFLKIIVHFKNYYIANIAACKMLNETQPYKALYTALLENAKFFQTVDIASGGYPEYARSQVRCWACNEIGQIGADLMSLPTKWACPKWETYVTDAFHKTTHDKIKQKTPFINTINLKIRVRTHVNKISIKLSLN
jgi:hypothetical protein